MGALGDLEQVLADGERPTDGPPRFEPERLAGVVNTVTDPITVQAQDGRLVFANVAAARASGRESPADMLAATPGNTLARFELFDEAGRPVEPDQLPGRVALRTGTPQSLTVRYRDRESGAERWSAISATPLFDDAGRPEFAVNVVRDVTEAKAIESALRLSEARARLLADATRDLDESLDLEHTVAAAMAIAVPHLADWATLDLVAADGSTTRAAAVVADPDQAALAERLRGFAVQPGAGRAGDRAIAERRPVIASLSAEQLIADPSRPGLLETLRELGTTSAMAVPLIARGAVEGVMVLGACHDSRHYEEPDAAYAMELARRIALAVGNARLYAAEQAARRAAEELARGRETLLADLEAQRARFETVIRDLPSGVIVAEAPSGRTLIVNEAVDRILGTRGLAATDIWDDRVEAYRSDGSRYDGADFPLARTIRTGEAVDDEELRIVRADGTEAYIVARSSPIVDGAGRLVAGVVVFEDITTRRRQQVRTEFIARAGAILTSSLDIDETIAAVGSLAVHSVADWLAVDVVADDGRLEPLVLAHASPARAGDVAALRSRLDGLGAESSAARVVRTGEPAVAEVTREVLDEGLARFPEVARNEELSRSLDGLVGVSSVCVPLVAGGSPIGALTLATEGAARRMTDADVPFVVELAARVASAIQNARLFRDVGSFRTILDTVRDGVTLVSAETLRVTYANDAVLEQLGRDRDDVVGHMTPDWTEGLSAEQFRDYLAPILAGEIASRSLDVMRVRPDGTRVPVEIRWQLVDLRGTGRQLVAVSRDISDRIQTEQRLTQLATAEHARAAELNAIIGAIGEGLVVIDAAGRITLANPTAQQLLEPLEAWTLDALEARLEDPDGEARAALEVPGRSATLRLRPPTQRWVEISNYAVEDDANPGGEHIVILRDVTAAREREAVRDAFVGILSHELRTPVTTIYAGAKVLARNEPTMAPEARREIFEDVHAEAERLHRLVEDVVALNRFGEGTIDIGSEPVLLQRIVPTVVRSEQSRWPNGRFDVDVEPALPPVAGDPTYVEQVIRNLLANAVKYGGSSSTIRLVVRGDAEEVSLRVLDDGPGFPEEEADRLFELYYRSPATARHVSGSGIGLFVCSRLCAAMGGRIWAANRPEGGAEFGFALRVMTEDR
ncbi:MAG TPA: PAS domain S-box protein [Candidatus Limnocylindrales bacterium]|nr:PAS domain S-box protein [Candidatus Limnocylindrales bacterium]